MITKKIKGLHQAAGLFEVCQNVDDGFRQYERQIFREEGSRYSKSSFQNPQDWNAELIQQLR